MSVITVSASYGAGGSHIAPRIAERLGIPFIDRAIPVSVANQAGLSVDEAEAIARGAVGGKWWSVLSRLSTVSNGMLVPVGQDQDMGAAELVAQTATHLRAAADSTGCVVLGHAAALLLADRADALHVRFDGDPAGRVANAVRQHGFAPEAAAEEQKQNDKLRAAYVRQLHGADAASPEHYHLVIDTVRVPWDVAEQLVLAAVRS